MSANVLKYFVGNPGKNVSFQRFASHEPFLSSQRLGIRYLCDKTTVALFARLVILRIAVKCNKL